MIRAFMMVNGDIIIGDISPTHSNYIQLDFPALLIHQRNNHGPLGFMLDPWVPSELLKSTPVMLEADKIMATLELSDAMERFYKNWALAEQDKMKTFVSVFEKQIGTIEKQYLDRVENVKDQQQKSPMLADSQLTDALIEIFDNIDNHWGDPTITN